MRRIGLGFLCFGGFAAAAIASPANATPIACTSTTLCTYSLDNYVGSGSAPAGSPWGTITLTQDGSNIDVAVTLNPNIYFADTGAGLSFLWSFSGDPTLPSTDVTFPLSESGDFAFTSSVPAGLHEDGTGYWDYGIQCTGCGNGGSPPRLDALTFTIDGYTLSEFIQSVPNGNNPGYDFASDLCLGIDPTKNDGQGGCIKTGDVTADLTTNVVTGPTGGSGSTPVPEPITLAMFGTGLAAIAVTRRRKKRGA